MEPIITHQPHQTQNFRRFNAGPQHSLGETINRVRLRSSAPDLPMVWSQDTSGDKVLRKSNYIQDGDVNMFQGKYGHGMHGRMSDTRWDRPVHSFKFQYGRRFRDIIPPDKSTDVTMRGLPKFTYRHQIARVYNVKHYGEKFLPLPGPYECPKGQIPRGGNYPRITDQQVNGEATAFSNGLFNPNNPQRRSNLKRVNRSSVHYPLVTGRG